MNEKTIKAQKFQKIVAIGIGIVVFGFMISSYYFLSDDVPVQTSKKIDLPSDKINPQEIWTMRLEDTNKILEQKVKYLEEMVLNSQKALETIANENIKTANQKNKDSVELKNELKSLKEDLKNIVSEPLTNAQNYHKDSELAYPEPFQPVQYNGSTFQNQPFHVPEMRPKPILTEIIVCSSNERKVSNVCSSIPAGTSVKAVLISTVKMPCAISGFSDPQPIKLRILDDGLFSNGVRVHLKGGVIIASVVGDLSNERIYARLERLTQVMPNGDYVETAVAGCVTGQDGAFGIQGTVIDKSVNLVGNAAISGFFTGLSDYMQAKAGAKCIVNDTSCAPLPYGCDFVCQGGIQGSCSGFDKLTDYFLRRAEQVRPVIQVAAGQIVDITFTHGTEIGDLHVQEKIQEIREICRGQDA